MSLLVRNARVIAGDATNRRLIDRGFVACVDGVIDAIGSDSSSSAPRRADHVVDAGGKIVHAGFVCAHGHFYGMYARGMPVGDLAPGDVAARDFPAILRQLWWRLDRALTLDDVECSTTISAMSALRCGTTTVIDHHSSPSAIDGSLTRVAHAANRVGVRCATAYEVSDRNGDEAFERAVAENERFAVESRSESNAAMIGAAFGLHAPHTLSDASLRRCADAIARVRSQCAWASYGSHTHLAEDGTDGAHARALGAPSAARRLVDAGVLDTHSIVAHGVHVDDDDVVTLSHAQPLALVSAPSSNANNGVGVAPLERLARVLPSIALGTDGMHFDMINESQRLSLAAKAAALDPRRLPANVAYSMLVDGGARVASALLGRRVGVLDVGAVADLVMFDYALPTPLRSADAWPWHVAFGVSSSDVHSVFVGGRCVVDAHRLVTVDARDEARRARRGADDVWRRFAALS